MMTSTLSISKIVNLSICSLELHSISKISNKGRLQRHVCFRSKTEKNLIILKFDMIHILINLQLRAAIESKGPILYGLRT